MDKNIIKQIILSQQELISRIELVPRNYQLEKEANYVLVGLRRAGKTYLLYQHIQQLVAEGMPIEDVLFVNFEDERINDITKDELHLILESYKELYDSEPVIFLDEIQNVAGWEHFARRLADEKRRVMITGSNAYMLSREIAATLGGRYITKEVYPFDFREYLFYNGLKLHRNWMFGTQRSGVVRHFDNYFYDGGIAETFRLTDKRAWLTSLYQKVLFSDVVVRHRLRNEQGLSLLVKKIADSILQPTPVRRLQHILVSSGQKVTRETVASFIDYLHDAYLIFSISNFTDNLSERESMRKFYFYDNGILNLFLYQPETKLLENMVAIHLYKRYGNRLFYYRRNVEVDFVAPDDSLAVQVCYNLRDVQTRNREIEALVSLNKFKSMQHNLIITRDEEETVTIDNVAIEIVPVWKWLLEDGYF